jgi:hypothetical protein
VFGRAVLLLPVIGSSSGGLSVAEKYGALERNSKEGKEKKKLGNQLMHSAPMPIELPGYPRPQNSSCS